MKTRNNESYSKKLVILMIAMMAISIILIIFLLLKCCGSCGRQPTDDTLQHDSNASSGSLSIMTPEEAQDTLDMIVDEGMFNVAINTTPEFPSGTEPGNLNIQNVAANHYLMSVNITLVETGEKIYQSGLIDPNQYIEYVALDVPLSKGSYPATAVFTAYDPDTMEEMGNVAVEMTIYVDN